MLLIAENGQKRSFTVTAYPNFLVSAVDLFAL